MGAHTMFGSRMARLTSFVAFFIGSFSMVGAASAADATWRSTEAHVVDAGGSGFVSLLNVRVANHAENTAAAVTEVQFSDDGADWYGMPYTGEAQDWVLAGESGPASLLVRFLAADGTLSPVVRAGVTVDTEGPRTKALRRVRASSGGAACFRFLVRDGVSPRVDARIVVRGSGVRCSFRLGSIKTGQHAVRLALRLPRGTYRWSVRAVDMAGWVQIGRAAQTLVVK